MFDVTFGNVPDYRGIGIYCITNTENQKQYVGQSVHVQLRFKQHIHNISIGKCGKKFIDDIKNGAHFRHIRRKIKYIQTSDVVRGGTKMTPLLYFAGRP